MDARLGLALAVWLLCFGLVRPARAQSVALDLSACPEPSERDVRILAALELRGRLVERASADASQHIVVTCAEERAQLVSDQRATPRAIDLATVPPPLRARLLALAIAELARAEDEEALAPEPVTQDVDLEQLPRTVVATPPTRPRVPSASTRWRGFAAAGAQLEALPSWGASAALASLVRLYGPLALTGALSLGQTRRSIDLGALRVRTLSVRSGPALLHEHDRSLLYAGLGLRVTWLGLQGEPDDHAATRSAQFRTYVLGPELFAGLARAFGQHGLVAFEAQLAQQLRQVRAQVEGGQSLTLSSFRLALSALVGARW